MSSSRLTTMQIHRRFTQSCNPVYPQPALGSVAGQNDFDDSLTNLQWLQNLNLVNPIIPPIAVGSTAGGSRRINVGAYRKKGGRDLGDGPQKPRPGAVAQLRGANSPAKGDPGSQSANRQNVTNLQSRLLGGKDKSRAKNSKKNPLPPLIPQSRTPLPNQFRSRANASSRDSQTNSLPRLSGSNESLKLNTRLCENATILAASPEFTLLSDASPQYVLSPRQMDRDLLPGQVDYKNNPYVKPPFSHLALICMALRHNRDKKMTTSRICDWIKNNFIYYRWIGPAWQSSIRDNLVRHKCFQKMTRGNSDSGKGVFWRIDPKYEDKFSNGMLRKRRLASAGEEKGQSSSSSDKSSSRGCSPYIEPYSDYDFLTAEDFVDDSLSDDEADGNRQSSANSSAKGSAGHKRKQSTPQKNAKSKKSKQQQLQQQQQEHQNKINQLQDQAPELGSLKGDFTWNTILDDIQLDGSQAGSVNSSLSLSLTPTPSGTLKNTGGIGTTTSLTLSGEGILTDVMLPVDPSLLLTPSSSTTGPLVSSFEKGKPDSLQSPPALEIKVTKMERVLPDPVEEFINSQKGDPDDIIGRRRNGSVLNTPTLPDFDLDVDGFLKDVEALDLTVTGKQIEPPEEWVPVNMSLEAILCETQSDNLGLDTNIAAMNGLDLSPLDDMNDENSPRGQSKKKKGRRRPGSSSGSTTTSPRRITVVTTSNVLPRTSPRQQKSYYPPAHPWQELKTATDTIESLLGTSFDNVA